MQADLGAIRRASANPMSFLFAMSTTFKSFFIWLCFAPFFLMIGCAMHPHSDEGRFLNQAPGLLVGFDTMRYREFAADQTVRMTIDQASATHATEDGQRHFQAVALPAGAGQRTLWFESDLHSGIAVSDLGLRVPVFTFLDEKKNVLVRANAERMDSSSRLGSPIFVGAVPIPRDARHLVVHIAHSRLAPSLQPRSLTSSSDRNDWIFALLTLKVLNHGMATVIDTGMPEEVGKGRIFFLSSIDGNTIGNARGETTRASQGRGFYLQMVMPTRYVPARPMKVLLAAEHITAAPIQAIAASIAGTYFSVEAELDFAPEHGKKYVVKGSLVKDASSVWIEDNETGEVVTKKGTSADRPVRKR
jgi:hypothetical protein